MKGSVPEDDGSQWEPSWKLKDCLGSYGCGVGKSREGRKADLSSTLKVELMELADAFNMKNEERKDGQMAVSFTKMGNSGVEQVCGGHQEFYFNMPNTQPAKMLRRWVDM